MSRLLLFVLLMYIFSAESCIIHEKGKQGIKVIRLDDSSSSSSSDSDEPEIIAVHLPDRRRREIDSQESDYFCKTDEDCDPGTFCFTYTGTCVKGAWQRVVNSREVNSAN